MIKNSKRKELGRGGKDGRGWGRWLRIGGVGLNGVGLFGGGRAGW